MVEPSEGIAVRVQAVELQQAMTSLATIACQALGERPGELEVRVETILLDNVILDSQAQRVRGGMPVRGYARISIASHCSRQPAGTSIPHCRGTPKPRRLPLAAARTILESHDGSLSVSRTPDRVHMEVFLPSMAQCTPSRADRPGVPDRMKHVLYVDDYEAMCELAWEALTAQGYRVTCKQDAVEALTMVKAYPGAFDAVLVDSHMPRISGLDLARQLSEVAPQLRVALVSACVDAGLEVRARDAGACAVINKADTLDHMVRAVHLMLADTQGLSS
jgi:CheY-like chemotaxis protein